MVSLPHLLYSNTSSHGGSYLLLQCHKTCLLYQKRVLERELSADLDELSREAYIMPSISVAWQLLVILPSRSPGAMMMRLMAG